MPTSGRGVARRSDPALWEASKRRACTRARLCLHSARKMQWAVRDYKERGGTYLPSSPPASDTRLAKWTRERWRTHSGRPSKGRLRYLPDKAWSRLTPDQIRRTNAAKRIGYGKGKQWVRQPEDVARVASRARRAVAGKKRG